VRWVAFNLLIAIGYGLIAKFSIDFATLPGKVSAVWFPSGLATALVAYCGVWRVIPGIALGSLMGLFLDLLTLTPPLSASNLIFLEVVMTIGDCLQPIATIEIIKRLAGFPLVFSQVRTVVVFIFSTIVGPSISATIGITALCLVQTFPWSGYGISWLTWCLASTLANLLFTPPLLLWRRQAKLKPQFSWYERVLISGLGLCLSWITFIKGYPLEYMFFPLLLWSASRLGGFFTSILISLMSVLSILMTSKGYGPFVTESPTESLLLLQSFIAVFSATNIVLTAAIHERKVSELALETTLELLEEQVEYRTSELRESKAIVDSFFASAPLGLGIVDQALTYVKVNQLLANLNGVSIDHHLGQPIQQISPDRATNLEFAYQQVLSTGQAILNREETWAISVPPPQHRTWLTSYFPILDAQNLISKVGVIVMEISDRKQLELQLKLQARQDPLTALSNRLHFKEASKVEWHRCRRNRLCFSLIFLDIDEFKRYNDTYGHLAGDTCLIQVAQLLLTVTGRSSDLVARYGGEEFMIMLPGTDEIGAAHVAAFVREILHQQKIPHDSSSVCGYVTVSMGVVTCIPSSSLQIDRLIQSADEALYESKRQGRDRMTQVTLQSQ
jgi:diguanylate cyclase (GGDEF)-like protein